MSLVVVLDHFNALLATSPDFLVGVIILLLASCHEDFYVLCHQNDACIG